VVAEAARGRGRTHHKQDTRHKHDARRVAMELDLGPEIARFRAELRDWIAAEAPPGLVGLFDWNMVMTVGGGRGGQLAKAMAQPAYQEWAAKLQGQRLVCPQWPAEFGGQGMDAVRLVVLN
jgi:hypothetical protein